MNRFECSSMTGEELEFTLRVEQYSMRACKNYFESCEFESPSGDTKWSLVVYSSDGADYENYIDVRLKLKECSSNDGQFVRANVAIEDRFGLPSEASKKDVFFRGSGDAEVFSVTKGSISSCFGLKRCRLLPNDTLTLVCKLVILKENAKPFKTREDFEGSVEKREESRWNKISPHIKKYLFVFLSLLVAGYNSIHGYILACKTFVENYAIPIFNDFVIPFFTAFVFPLIKYIILFIKYVYHAIKKIKRYIDNLHKAKPDAANSIAVSGKHQYNRYLQNNYNNYPRENMMLCAEETTRKIYLPQNSHYRKFARKGQY